MSMDSPSLSIPKSPPIHKSSFEGHKEYSRGERWKDHSSLINKPLLLILWIAHSSKAKQNNINVVLPERVVV